MKKTIVIPQGQSSAIFNAERTHRYALWRMWDLDKPGIMFIGLNPSRADETKNDATIIRCINFANLWGYGRMYFLNLYSYITPYVNHVPVDKTFEGWQPLRKNLEHAVGEDYNKHFISYAKVADKIVACWGDWPFTQVRAKNVLSMITEPYCFGTTKDGSPRHPLYLAASTRLQKYNVQLWEKLSALPFGRSRYAKRVTQTSPHS